MDLELLLALLGLWISTVVALVLFLSLFLGEGFGALHPHSADVEERHGRAFVVVSGKTECKQSHVVKSISEYCAPRGASSNKHFTALSVVLAVAGTLGSLRWHFVGDAGHQELALAMTGWAALSLVAAFELDVEPERFVEEKLRVLGWLLHKVGAKKYLKFDLGPYSEEFRRFVGRSRNLRRLFEPQVYQSKDDMRSYVYRAWWLSLHMVGAVVYVTCVTASLWINEPDSHSLFLVCFTASCFGIFCLLSFLAGDYLPLPEFLQGYVLAWVPWLLDTNFDDHLVNAVADYVLEESPHLATSASVPIASPHPVKARTDRSSGGPGTPPKHMLKRADIVASLDKGMLSKAWSLRLVRSNPAVYRRTVSLCFVLFELVAMVVPAIGTGVLWIAALCDHPPYVAFYELQLALVRCALRVRPCEEVLTSCLLASDKAASVADVFPGMVDVSAGEL